MMKSEFLRAERLGFEINTLAFVGIMFHRRDVTPTCLDALLQTWLTCLMKFSLSSLIYRLQVALSQDVVQWVNKDKENLLTEITNRSRKLGLSIMEIGSLLGEWQY